MRIFSVDDHVVEPPDLWERWLPHKHASAAPRVVRAPWEPASPSGISYRMAVSGPSTDFWVFDDRHFALPTALACAGLDQERSIAHHSPIAFDEMRPGCWDPAARLGDLDLNGVEWSLCFPTFARFCGQTFNEVDDRELGMACLVAYNDWMVEEWCGGGGGRLVPLCLIPLWDPNLAAAEVRRNAGRGVRAVAFSELPAYLGLPSIHNAQRHWDPFFQACEETATVICMHVGSSSQVPRPSDDCPAPVMTSIQATNSMIALSDWLLSGVLARFPRLKIAFSEGQIGWIPYMTERIDSLWRRPHMRASLDPALTEPPSTYIAGRVYGCFFEDAFGLGARDDIGVRQIMFETDYPHQDTTWPDTSAYVECLMADVDEADRERILYRNAVELFGMEDAT
jgi:predicted TIM-barrel fold metal-dependent hydrolase